MSIYRLILRKKRVGPKKIAEELVEWMDKASIDIAVILSIAPYISNEHLAKIVDYEPKRFIGFASVVPNPVDVAIEELRTAIVDLGLRGLKLYPGMQGFCLRSTHLWKLLDFAGKELGIPVVIDAMLGDFSSLYFKGSYLPSMNSIDDYALLPFVAPNTKIILAHMGGAFHFEDVLLIAVNKNVYVDTSYSIVTIAEKIGVENLARYIKALGPEKFIFGSDTILGLTSEQYSAKRQIEIISQMNLTKDEKELIFYKNAMRLLGIS